MERKVAKGKIGLVAGIAAAFGAMAETTDSFLLPDPVESMVPTSGGGSTVYCPNYSPAYSARIAKNRTRNRISRKSRQRNR